MRLLAKTLVCTGLIAILALAWTPPAFAQGATTSSITGAVTDPDGVSLPGVTVTVVHEPTGTRYTAYTRGDGRFSVFNVRVGGPYSVAAELQGFAALQRTDLNVGLGEELEITFALQLQAVAETLTVTATSDPIINPSRTGATSLIPTRALEQMPTLNRSIADYARLDPYFKTTDGGSGSATAISVAGRNNRYNNIQIDGSVNNDLFGLAAQGTPGGQTETNAISLDAVKEINLLVSPYDVRQGGFTGGGINMVTKSGANDFHGTGFYYRRGNGMVGTIDDSEVGTFSDNNFGGTVGGPIVRDRVFFFGSYEGVRRKTPAGYSANGTSGQDFGATGESELFRGILMNTYGYDPGGLDEVSRATDNNIIFGRVDANLTDNHQLTVRHNYVGGTNQILRPSRTFYPFPDYLYNIDITTNSFVGQLNSVFGEDKFNEFRITAQTIKGPRFGPDPVFPSVDVDISGGRTLQAGTEDYSTANDLDQTIFEITDDLTMMMGDDHTVIFGTHNEIFNFENLFIRQNFGAYSFDSLADLERGWAQSYDYSFSATADPREAAKFGVIQLGFYAGDTWNVSDTVSLNYGLRLDIPILPDKPTYNSTADDVFGVDTSDVPSGVLLWSPRVGFNWDPNADGVQQVRGGIGLFSGRTPYVWLSNQYGNTGNEFTRISSYLGRPINAGNNITFVADPLNQPTDVGNASTNEVDVTDPDYHFPSVMRATLGYDRELPWQNMTFTAEFIYATTNYDVYWENLNIVPTGETFFDGRPLFGRDDSSFRDVINMTNTRDGRQTNIMFKVQRRYADNWMAQGSYMYGSSTVVNDGLSSQARSNWRYNYTGSDPNLPEVGPSLFSPGHRINFTVSYDIPVSTTAVRLAFFYDGQQGRPYSTTYAYDVNGDYESQDLLTVLTSDDVVVTGGTDEQWDAYIAGDEGLANNIGQIIPRNESRAPWRNFSDFRASIDLPVATTNIEFSLDIRNLFNLLNSDWGRIEYAAYNEQSPVRYRGMDSASGLPIYELRYVVVNPENKFTVDDLRSRWQMRFGARVSF